MARGIVASLALLLVLGGCAQDPDYKADEAAPAVEQSAAANAPETKTTTAPPVPPAQSGFKASGTSFSSGGGGSVNKGVFWQTNFAIVNAKIGAPTPVKQVRFKLSSPGVNNVYPKVTLQVLGPGGPDYRPVGSFTVKGDFEETFDLEPKAGMYAVRIIYNGTDPAANTRPALAVHLVELLP